MIPLDVGRIIWKVYDGARGEGKLRPMIVLTSWKEIAQTQQAAVVVCSTDFPEPPKMGEIVVPSKADTRYCATGLPERTVAVMDWTTTIDVSSLKQDKIGGVVPTPIMRAICEHLGIPFKSGR